MMTTTEIFVVIGFTIPLIWFACQVISDGRRKFRDYDQFLKDSEDLHE